MLGADGHLFLRGLGAQDIDRALDNLVEVEFLPVDLAPLLQHVAKTENDIPGALVVIPDVGQYLPDEIEVGRLPLQYGLRRLRVAANGAEQASGRLPVRADKVHLQQVILNLATNAMDAMVESATTDRKLVFQTASKGDAKVEMSISDTGGGIPKDRLDNIFAAFYTTKPNGTGLGLSIARAIVETYGGKIWADNRAGGGAVFRFVLPRAQAT